jgi:hypothetical protein
MALVVNKSERAITIIDVLLSPGVPTEMPEDYLDHPSVEVYFDAGILEEVDENVSPPLIQEEKPKPKEPAKPAAQATKPPTKGS